MSTRGDLPRHVADGPFTVSDALAAGATRSRMRAADLATHYWGTRTMDAGAPDLRDRCLLLQSRLPACAFFSHTTAALLYELPVPLYAEHDRNIHVSVPSPHRALKAKGLIGHKVQIGDRDVVSMGGIHMSAPARLFCELSAGVDLYHLVAVGDSLIARRRPLLTREDLAIAVAGYPGRRGRARLIRALDLIDDAAESPPESILRAILVLGGLPKPDVNRSVLDEYGSVVARIDLSYPREKVAIEYQGDYHRENRGQWRKDMSRRRRLEARGWYVIEFNADDVRQPETLVRFVRSVLVSRRQHTA